MELDITLNPFLSDDWEDFRRIRLRAIQMHPHYFLQLFEKAVLEPESFWRERLSVPRQCIYGLYDSKSLIGLTGVFTHRDFPDGRTADFGMSFIEPDHRGRYLSQKFYDARIAWARENSFDRIIVGHHENNKASKKAILRNGFVHIGEYMREWPDGTSALDVQYELKLEF